ncbi:hypothetical protein [Salegentibacter sediminis]|uniref:hypothetical protein n=1 Tax=Salegentibacter sediminis TaxID=1930251 RepID=UPI0009BD7E27|nr:hypothetical protein [Salegentibacter sediminis]
MRVNYKYGIIFSAFLLFFSLEVFTQTSPPQPQMSQNKGHGPPCAPKGDGSDGFPNPPPPGLCLPIDDYIPYLLVGGMLIGLIYTSQKVAKPGGVH